MTRGMEAPMRRLGRRIGYQLGVLLSAGALGVLLSAGAAHHALGTRGALRNGADGPMDRARPAPAVVKMTNLLKFEPETLTVTVGETVTWKNGSDLVHSVTADPAKATIKGSVKLPAGAHPFDAGLLAPGATFEHRFTVPGTYRYFCIPHEGAKMVGTVVVRRAGT